MRTYFLDRFLIRHTPVLLPYPLVAFCSSIFPPPPSSVPPLFKTKDCFPKGQPGLQERNVWTSTVFSANSLRVSSTLPLDWLDGHGEVLEVNKCSRRGWW